MALAEILHKVWESIKELEQGYCKAPNLLTWEPQFIDKVRSATRHLAFPELDISLGSVDIQTKRLDLCMDRI